QSDGNVLIGGDFSTVNGVVRPRVARLYGDSVAPSLNIARSNAFLILSWPVTVLNFQLQESTDLSLPNSWSFVAQSAATNGNQVTVTVSATTGRKFFRLQAQ
ncbi:MAG TPA: delta-60 repeat domain-containing protein, partial [Methylomirabilota bacterium]|nr:delta-60 repeat domain-containing protein [Methylomirabilota bacterium]